MNVSACLQACRWRDPQRLGGIGARHWSRRRSRRLLVDSAGWAVIGWGPVLGLYVEENEDEDDGEEGEEG